MIVLEIIVGLIVLAVIAAKLYLAVAGKEKVVVHTEERTPFVVESQDDTSMVLSSKVRFANEGKQVCTIMDAIVRPQLPYEQYDAIEARGKAETEGCPREDDYFEAVLIEHQESMNVIVKVKLTARKGLDLKTALTHMVDLPLDLIYMETGRTPWHYSKVRIVLKAAEIAKLAGVTLVRD